MLVLGRLGGSLPLDQLRELDGSVAVTRLDRSLQHRSEGVDRVVAIEEGLLLTGVIVDRPRIPARELRSLLIAEAGHRLGETSLKHIWAPGEEGEGEQ